MSKNSPAFSMLAATRFPVSFIWDWVSGYIFLILPFLTNVPVEALPLVLQIAGLIKLQVCFTFPDPILATPLCSY